MRPKKRRKTAASPKTPAKATTATTTPEAGADSLRQELGQEQGTGQGPEQRGGEKGEGLGQESEKAVVRAALTGTITPNNFVLASAEALTSVKVSPSTKRFLSGEPKTTAIAAPANPVTLAKVLAPDPISACAIPFISRQPLTPRQPSMVSPAERPSTAQHSALTKPSASAEPPLTAKPLTSKDTSPPTANVSTPTSTDLLKPTAMDLSWATPPDISTPTPTDLSVVEAAGAGVGGAMGVGGVPCSSLVVKNECSSVVAVNSESSSLAVDGESSSLAVDRESSLLAVNSKSSSSAANSEPSSFAANVKWPSLPGPPVAELGGNAAEEKPLSCGERMRERMELPQSVGSSRYCCVKEVVGFADTPLAPTPTVTPTLGTPSVREGGLGDTVARPMKLSSAVERGGDGGARGGGDGSGVRGKSGGRGDDGKVFANGAVSSPPAAAADFTEQCPDESAKGMWLLAAVVARRALEESQQQAKRCRGHKRPRGGASIHPTRGPYAYVGGKNARRRSSVSESPRTPSQATTAVGAAASPEKENAVVAAAGGRIAFCMPWRPHELRFVVGGEKVDGLKPSGVVAPTASTTPARPRLLAPPPATVAPVGVAAEKASLHGGQGMRAPGKEASWWQGLPKMPGFSAAFEQGNARVDEEGGNNQGRALRLDVRAPVVPSVVEPESSTLLKEGGGGWGEIRRSTAPLVRRGRAYRRALVALRLGLAGPPVCGWLTARAHRLLWPFRRLAALGWLMLAEVVVAEEEKV